MGRECLELVRPLAEARQIELRRELPAAPCDGDAKLISPAVISITAAVGGVRLV